MKNFLIEVADKVVVVLVIGGGVLLGLYLLDLVM